MRKTLEQSNVTTHELLTSLASRLQENGEKLHKIIGDRKSHVRTSYMSYVVSQAIFFCRRMLVFFLSEAITVDLIKQLLENNSGNKFSV